MQIHTNEQKEGLQIIPKRTEGTVVVDRPDLAVPIHLCRSYMPERGTSVKYARFETLDYTTAAFTLPKLMLSLASVAAGLGGLKMLSQIATASGTGNVFTLIGMAGAFFLTGILAACAAAKTKY